jgi:hypothetical protein
MFNTAVNEHDYLASTYEMVLRDLQPRHEPTSTYYVEYNDILTAVRTLLQHFEADGYDMGEPQV